MIGENDQTQRSLCSLAMFTVSFLKRVGHVLKRSGFKMCPYFYTCTNQLFRILTQWNYAVYYNFNDEDINV